MSVQTFKVVNYSQRIMLEISLFLILICISNIVLAENTNIFSKKLLKCAAPNKTLTFIVDTNPKRGNLLKIHTSENGLTGDMGQVMTFNQALLDHKKKSQVGRNSGFCIRTQPKRSWECQWTLTLYKTKLGESSITVGGQEYDEGVSKVGILSGTGVFRGITGEMISYKNEAKSGKNKTKSGSGDISITQQLCYSLLS